jgi:outer membrane cobalamin receptor
MTHCPWVIAGLIAAPVAAQPADVPPNLIVTATRIAAPPTQQRVVIASADVAHSDSVAQALAQLPDVFVQMPGGRSGFGALFLRGADPNFTTVLLDGIPLANAVSSRGGAVNLAEIGTPGIDRVVVTAGSLSSVLGSGALAGAVDLIAAGGLPTPRFDLSAAAGTRGDFAGVAGWRGPVTAGSGGAITASYDNDGEASPQAAFAAATVLAKLASRDPNRPDRLLLRYNHVVSRQFPDNSGGADFAVRRETERRTVGEALAGGTLRLVDAAGWRLDASTSWLDRRDTVQSPGVVGSAQDPFGIPAGTDATHYRRLLGQVVAGTRATATLAAAGIELGQEWGDSDAMLDFGVPVPMGFRARRTSIAGFVEAGRTFDALTLTGAARVDAIDGFDPRLTGRLGLRYHPAGSDVSVAASVGSSFKAPSFYALGNPFVGNPDLRPESLRSAEAVLAWTPSDRLQASISGFRNDATDLIDFVADPAPRLVNRARVRSTGVVAMLAVPVHASVDLRASVQYVETRDRATAAPLLNRPPWRAALSLAWQASPTVSLIARYDLTDARHDTSVPTGLVRLPAYGLFGLAADWQLPAGFALRLRLENALDADYADAVGFPGPSRRARLALAKTF